jgi:hypothetical protein
MDRESHSKGKTAAAILATVAAILLWGFGAEYVLQNYVFVSPPESSFQKIK